MNKRPHIVLLLSDEHRGQAMSHMGDSNVRTPHMDRLAAEGVSFSRACCNSPICTPSRGTLFSGRHSHCGPVAGFFDHYKASFPSLATELRKGGYRTAYFGKWHCGIVHDQIPSTVRENPEQFPGGVRNRTPEHLRAGFQDWLGFENLNQHFAVSAYRNDQVEPDRFTGFETDVMTSEVIDYLQNYADESPLFLVLSVTPPHFPMTAPAEWLRHDPQTLNVPPNFLKWKGQPPPHCVDHDHTQLTEAQAREKLAVYYAMIENLDANLGRLKAALEELPSFQEDTLFIYLSDHGDFMGSHGWVCQKSQPHEESIRVPAIFHWPGHIPTQGKVDEIFGLIDFLATILGCAGLPIPQWNQGADWSNFLQTSAPAPTDFQLLEIVGNPRWTLDHLDWRGFVTKKWKYAFYETGHEILFDLENDPWELTNLVHTHAKRLPEMRLRLLHALRETREPSFDVLITHGVPPDQCVINVAPNPYPIFALSEKGYRHFSQSGS